MDKYNANPEFILLVMCNLIGFVAASVCISKFFTHFPLPCANKIRYQ